MQYTTEIDSFHDSMSWRRSLKSHVQTQKSMETWSMLQLLSLTAEGEQKLDLKELRGCCQRRSTLENVGFLINQLPVPQGPPLNTTVKTPPWNLLSRNPLTAGSQSVTLLHASLVRSVTHSWPPPSPSPFLSPVLDPALPPLTSFYFHRQLLSWASACWTSHGTI